MSNNLEIKLANGHKIVAELCEFGSDIPPEILVYIQEEHGVVLQDIALVRAKEKVPTVVDDVNVGTEVLVWADENHEDYTHKFSIAEHKFLEDDLEDEIAGMISYVFGKYDMRNGEDNAIRMKKLLQFCMEDIKNHPYLEKSLQTNDALEHFVTQSIIYMMN